MTTKALFLPLATLSMACLATAGAVVPATAQQGYQYTITNTTDGQVMTSEMWVWGSNLRMDIWDGDAQTGTVRFDGDRMIFSDGDQYYEMTRAQAEQMAGMMAGAGGMLEQAMEQARKHMSEEEMKELEKMGIPGFGGGDDEEEAPESRLVSSGQMDDSPMGACELFVYEWDNGDPDQELCVSKERIEGFEETRAAIQAFSEFFEPFRVMMENGPVANLGTMQQNAMERIEDLDGFPVKGKQWANGSLASEWTMTDAARADMGPDDFGPPEGVEKADIDIGAIGR